MKELFLLRGIPGSGKSTVAKSIGGVHCEADQYFMVNGEYVFEPTHIKDAHAFCQGRCQGAMEAGAERIVVSNTFTQEWEMESYMNLAKIHEYRVFSLIVENRHDGINEHNVPQTSIDRMKNRFEIKL